MDRRDWLVQAAKLAALGYAGDQLELLDRLGWRRRFFPSVDVAGRALEVWRIQPLFGDRVLSAPWPAQRVLIARYPLTRDQHSLTFPVHPGFWELGAEHQFVFAGAEPGARFHLKLDTHSGLYHLNWP